MRASVAALVYVLSSSAVMAQSLPTYTPVPPFGIPGFTEPGYPGGAIGPNDYFSVLSCPPGPVNPLTCGSRELNVQALVDYLHTPQGAAGLSSLQQQLTSMAAQIDRNTRKLSDGIAMSSAITIIPPNPGDRFSLSVGGAGFDGRGAASVSGTARLTDQTLVYAGVAVSQTQTLLKGGAAFSFR